LFVSLHHERQQTRSPIMKYSGLRNQMKASLCKKKEALQDAIDNDDQQSVDELKEEIEALEWQIECVEDQMFSDYSNY
jgi:polyhydroxyalkanoate synthesis regulator phasin